MMDEIINVRILNIETNGRNVAGSAMQVIVCHTTKTAPSTSKTFLMMSLRVFLVIAYIESIHNHNL